MARSKYQFFDALRPEELSALREDIRQRGCFCPVEVDDHDNILDGYHRVQICNELGIKYKKIIRTFRTEGEKIEHALKMNLLRRHLGPISWANAFKKLCKVRGVHLGKGQRNDLSSDKGTCATVAQVAAEVGVPKRTAYNRLEVAEVLANHPDLAEKVDSGRMEVKRALRAVRERNFENRWKTEHVATDLPVDCRIEHCDFRKLKIKEHSIDLIHTDPPYGKDYKNIWRDIGVFAKKTLKPGHLMIIYTGQVCFNDALRQLEENLKYVWIGCLIYSGGNYPNYYPYKIQSRSSPLLFMSNGNYEPRDWMNDGVMGGGPDKTHHPWQKNLEESKYYIERLTKPGETVCDPFLGSGTTGVGATQLGRRFIGCDVDGNTVNIARNRISVEGARKDNANNQD